MRSLWRSGVKGLLRRAAGLMALGLAAWFGWVGWQIRWYATHDEARPADAIAVFGAAEYDGRPSPVLRARLQKGLALYREKLAPAVITLGGGTGDDGFSEGEVGQQYLLARGVPERAVIAETASADTRASARALAQIAQANGYRSVIAVSDGTHLFRIRALCRAEGLEVWTSPRREEVALPWKQRLKRVGHELASYTGWRVGVLR